MTDNEKEMIAEIKISIIRGIINMSDETLLKSAIGAFEDIIEKMPSAQPEITRCKDCGHFHYDTPYVIQGVPVLGHEVCDFWGDGCKTSENGYCSFAERREDERPES